MHPPNTRVLLVVVVLAAVTTVTVMALHEASKVTVDGPTLLPCWTNQQQQLRRHHPCWIPTTIIPIWHRRHHRLLLLMEDTACIMVRIMQKNIIIKAVTIPKKRNVSFEHWLVWKKKNQNDGLHWNDPNYLHRIYLN